MANKHRPSPAPPTGGGERVEPGPFIFDVVSIRNLLKPKKEDEHHDPATAKRMLEIILTDGAKNVKASEWKRINTLSEDLPPGTRITLSNVRVRGGTFWLEPESVSDILPPDPDRPPLGPPAPPKVEAGNIRGAEQVETKKKVEAGNKRGPEQVENKTKAEVGNKRGPEQVENKNPDPVKRVRVEGGEEPTTPAGGPMVVAPVLKPNKQIPVSPEIPGGHPLPFVYDLQEWEGKTPKSHLMEFLQRYCKGCPPKWEALLNPYAPDSEPPGEKQAADGSIVKPTYPRHAARAVLPANLGVASLVTNKFFPTQKEAEHCTSIIILAHVGAIPKQILALHPEYRPKPPLFPPFEGITKREMQKQERARGRLAGTNGTSNPNRPAMANPFAQLGGRITGAGVAPVGGAATQNTLHATQARNQNMQYGDDIGAYGTDMVAADMAGVRAGMRGGMGGARANTTVATRNARAAGGAGHMAAAHASAYAYDSGEMTGMHPTARYVRQAGDMSGMGVHAGGYEGGYAGGHAGGYAGGHAGVHAGGYAGGNAGGITEVTMEQEVNTPLGPSKVPPSWLTSKGGYKNATTGKSLTQLLSSKLQQTTSAHPPHTPAYTSHPTPQTTPPPTQSTQPPPPQTQPPPPQTPPQTPMTHTQPPPPPPQTQPSPPKTQPPPPPTQKPPPPPPPSQKPPSPPQTQQTPLLPQAFPPFQPKSAQPALPLAQPLLPQTSQPLLSHTNQPLLPHTNQPLLPHTNQPLLPHTSQPLLPQPPSTMKFQSPVPKPPAQFAAAKPAPAFGAKLPAQQPTQPYLLAQPVVQAQQYQYPQYYIAPAAKPAPIPTTNPYLQTNVAAQSLTPTTPASVATSPYYAQHAAAAQAGAGAQQYAAYAGVTPQYAAAAQTGASAQYAAQVGAAAQQAAQAAGAQYAAQAAVNAQYAAYAAAASPAAYAPVTTPLTAAQYSSYYSPQVATPLTADAYGTYYYAAQYPAVDATGQSLVQATPGAATTTQTTPYA